MKIHKLSKRHFNIRRISKRDVDENEMIKKMKATVKKDPDVIAKFEKYKIPIDELDGVSVEFADLDVSAKTKDRKIYLNRAMLDPDSDVKDPTHYLAHEIIHYLQQTTGNVEDQRDADYIDKPTEVEAFQAQVDFKERHEGGDEAERYVEDLLDYHEVGGKEREKKKDELME